MTVSIWCVGNFLVNHETGKGRGEANRGRNQLNSVGVGHVQVQLQPSLNGDLQAHSPFHWVMPPSIASEASSDGHTFVPLNEDANTVGAARNNDDSPRDFQRLIVPAFLHLSGSPLSRAGCVHLDLLSLHIFLVSSHFPPNLLYTHIFYLLTVFFNH